MGSVDREKRIEALEAEVAVLRLDAHRLRFIVRTILEKMDLEQFVPLVDLRG